MTTLAQTRVAAKPEKKTREVDTRPLLWPSVIVLFLWMIVPLAMTLYFSAIRYNLLNPTLTGFAGLRKLRLSVRGSGVLDLAVEHPGAGGFGAGHYGGAGHAVRGALQPGVLRPWRGPTAGDRALLRHAHGQRAGVEEHDDAPGLRTDRLAANPGGHPAHRLVYRLPDAVRHHHRRLAVGAVRLSDPADRHPVPGRRAKGSGADRRGRTAWRCSSTSPCPI